nr:hypothetical protein [Brevibacillus laterosporus]
MPTWFIVQISLLLLWVFLGFFYYRVKLWTVGNPLNGGSMLLLTFSLIVPIIWLGSSFIYGIYYFLSMNSKENFSAPLICLIIIPAMTLIILAITLFHRERKRRLSFEHQLELIGKTKQSCDIWSSQFDFILEEDMSLEVYISKGKPTGRLTVKNLDEDQILMLDKHREELPEGIFLWLVPKHIPFDSKHLH